VYILHGPYAVIWLLGARPNIVSCSPWEFENANPFINNVNDVCAKAS